MYSHRSLVHWLQHSHLSTLALQLFVSKVINMTYFFYMAHLFFFDFLHFVFPWEINSLHNFFCHLQRKVEGWVFNVFERVLYSRQDWKRRKIQPLLSSMRCAENTLTILSSQALTSHHSVYVCAMCTASVSCASWHTFVYWWSLLVVVKKVYKLAGSGVMFVHHSGYEYVTACVSVTVGAWDMCTFPGQIWAKVLVIKNQQQILEVTLCKQRQQCGNDW